MASNSTKYEIPTEQWAQVVETSGSTTYKRIPVPRPSSPGQVLIHILYSGVCHTDLHARNSDWPIPRSLPLIGGHEGVGVVVSHHDSSSVSTSSNLPLGTRVGVKWLNSSCLSCAFCCAGDEPLCAAATLSGYTVPGTFQEYCVADAAHVARIPASVPDSELGQIAPVLCAGITVYKGLKEAGIKAGEWVAVVGAAGGLGSMAVQYAKAMGYRVLAVDGGGGEEKRRVCVDVLGAERYVDYTCAKDDQEMVKLVRDATAGGDDDDDGLLSGEGPHAVLLLAVQERPFQQATQYVRSRGTVVCIGLPANAQLRAPVFDTVVRMITIKGSYVGNRRDTAEALDFYARGLIKVLTKVVGLSELSDVYARMEEGSIVGRYVVDTSR